MKGEFFSYVGRNISDTLEEKGLSQQFLSKEIGVSKQVVSKIVSGAKAINVEEISKIADVLEVSVDQLLKIPSKNSKTADRVCFMGEVKKNDTKAKIKLLQTVIDEIIFLEDLKNDKA